MYNDEILKADRLFRNHQYQDAINSYTHALTKLDDKKSRHRVQASIKLCRSKLGHKLSSCSYFQIDKTLTDDFAIMARSRAVSRNIEIKYPILTDKSKINAREIMNRIKISPYQTSLILLAAKLVEERKILGSIMRDLDCMDEFHLNIGDIISCVIDSKYAKHLQTALARGSKPYVLNGIALDKLQSMYMRFKEIDNLIDLELFLRKEIKEKLVTLEARQVQSSKANPKNKVYAGSIFLNEKKYLELCLNNHYELISKWCLVEGTCLGYPTSKVSSEGFSKDFSSLILQLFPDPAGKLQYIPHGWTENEGEDAKSELRNDYLKGANGKVLAIIDIDEFYPKQSFDQAVKKILEGYNGVTVPQIHFWRNLNQFIIGGYYDISHMRFFKMHKGLKYINNHNFPEKPDGTRLDKMECYKFERKISSKDENALWSGTFCYHMGFAKDADDMKDKTDYYINRGEKVTRPDTTKSRAAWFTDEIPDNCKVLPFNQEVYGVLGQ